MVTGAPDLVAPFSHAVEADGWVFVTGQMPCTGTANDSPYPEGIEAQTRQVMENLQRVLAGCGLGLENVVSEFLSDLAESRRSGRDDVLREFVGVDDGIALRPKESRHRAFSGG